MVLTAALDRLRDRPTCHTTRTLARDKNGQTVNPTSPYAVQWCALGLILNARAVDSLDHPDVFPATQIMRLAACEQGYRATSVANDLHGRAGAMRLFTRSIELLDTSEFSELLKRAETARPVDLNPLALAGEKGTE